MHIGDLNFYLRICRLNDCPLIMMVKEKSHVLNFLPCSFVLILQLRKKKIHVNSGLSLRTVYFFTA